MRWDRKEWVENGDGVEIGKGKTRKAQNTKSQEKKRAREGKKKKSWESRKGASVS